MKGVLLLIVAMATTAVPQSTTKPDVNQRLWEAFKAKYAKEYSSEKEENYRKKIFLENLAFLRDHNAEHVKGGTALDVGVHEFADMTTEEFMAKIGCLKEPDNSAAARKYIKFKL